MELSADFWDAEARAALLAAQEIRVVYTDRMNRSFYQWLLEQTKKGVRTEILVPGQLEQLSGDLGMGYFRHFEKAGGRIIQSTIQLEHPFILMEKALLYLEINAITGIKYKLDKTPGNILKCENLWHKLSREGEMRYPGMTSDLSAQVPVGASGQKLEGAIQIKLDVSSALVEINERFDLSWSVKGAQQVQISPLIGEVPSSGSRVIAAEKTTEFVLTATNATQQISRMVRVEVDPKPKIEYILSGGSPSNDHEVALQPTDALGQHFCILEGQSLKLYWRVYQAETIQVDGSPVQAKGNMRWVPENTRFYTIWAKNKHGEVQKTIQVEVVPIPKVAYVQDTIHLNIPQIEPRTLQTEAFRLESPVFPLGPQTETFSQAPTTPPAELKIPGIWRFLWFCAGADQELLQKCPASEGHKYAGIGAAVLLTGLMATLSGGYAMFVAFQHWAAALGFGIFWGAIIFNLDRLIVSAIKKEGSSAEQWQQALPRILLALVLSFVISKPLELRIFQPEILEILEYQKIDKIRRTEMQFQVKTARIEQKIEQLKTETQQSFQVREALYQEYRCECDGTCGTGKTGRGSECQRKEAKYQQAEQEYQALKKDNDQLITAARAEQNAVQIQQSQTLQEVSTLHASGLVAQLSASQELPLLPGLFLALLILMVEITPVISKIMSPQGPYDRALLVQSTRFNAAQESSLQQDQSDTESQNELATRLQQAKNEQEIEQKKEVWRLISAAQLQLVQEQLKQWMEEERKNSPKTPK
jgi:hypothetical protein